MALLTVVDQLGQRDRFFQKVGGTELVLRQRIDGAVTDIITPHGELAVARPFLQQR